MSEPGRAGGDVADGAGGDPDAAAGGGAKAHLRVAVFLMALGGPDSLANVEPYLLDLRGGRPTSPELVEEIRERYRATGGRSPVLGITRELAAKLEARRPVRAIVGLRHWHPFIAEAWAEVVALAPERVPAVR